MNATTEFGLFIKLALAVIKGDDAEARAIKIQKKAIACLTAQIAAKEFHQLSLEEAIEKVESDYNYVELESSDEIYEHLDYVLANNKTEAYEKYKENSLKKSTGQFYFFREQLEIIEIVDSIE